MSGGLLTLAEGEPLSANRDGAGYRPTAAGGWAWSSTKGVASDFDLLLIDTLTGVKNGFDALLGGSDFIEGETDHVLLDYNVLGASDYTVEAVTSAILDVGSGGTFGPFQVGPGHMLH